MKKQIKSFIKRNFVQDKYRANLDSDLVQGGPPDSEYTFLMVVRQGFDIDFPNANSNIRLGFCQGFADIGVKYKIIDRYDLDRELEFTKNPIIFLSIYDYLDIGRSTIKKLRDYDHFVWVNPDFVVYKNVYEKYNYIVEYEELSKITKLVSYSEPSFVFAPVPPSYLEYYSMWTKIGLEVQSIPLACNQHKYYPVTSEKYKDVELAFVGGYWPKKAISFDKYLKPYEGKLSVYGYSKWPYKNYGGLLPDGDEKILYHNAKVSPAISEPHAEVTGDIVERVFKILGSGGFAVTDVITGYHELFSNNELCIPNTLAEYKDMVNTSLTDHNFNKNMRTNGKYAIINKHTYKHRAQTILKYLNVSQG